MKKFIVSVNGNRYEVDVEEVRNGEARSAPVQKSEVKPAVQAQKSDSSVPSGAETVKAPMPGTIIKVNVKTGDQVRKGQPLLILEAMKMENEICAPGDGTVASVNASQGASVNTGDVLLSLK
jgi:biotin carboxyl carrier protein